MQKIRFEVSDIAATSATGHFQVNRPILASVSGFDVVSMTLLLLQISTFNLQPEDCRWAWRSFLAMWGCACFFLVFFSYCKVFIFAQAQHQSASMLQLSVLDSDTKGSGGLPLGTDRWRHDGRQQFFRCRLCKH